MLSTQYRCRTFGLSPVLLLHGDSEAMRIHVSRPRGMSQSCRRGCKKSSSSDNYILFPELAQMFHLVTASFIFLFYLFRKKKKKAGRFSVTPPHLADTEEKANVTCDQINDSFGHGQDDGCVGTCTCGQLQRTRKRHQRE